MAAGLARERRPCFVFHPNPRPFKGSGRGVAYDTFCPKIAVSVRKSCPEEITRTIPLPMWTRRATTAKLKIEKSDL